MDKKKVIELIKKGMSYLNRSAYISSYREDFEKCIEEAIEELNKPEWISVEDELPPYEEEVFVANIANPKGVWRTYRTKWDCPEKDKNEFSCPKGFTITHWHSSKMEE